MRRLTNGSCQGERHARARRFGFATTLSTWLMLGLALQSCGVRPCSPGQLRERTRIDLDERVDDWRMNGETISPRFIHAADGCYLLEAKYSEDYARVHGASSLWGVSPVVALIDTAARTEISHYETGYVSFALQVRSQHTYHVTATFDGDAFKPRIIELNSAAERTREILPLRSSQDADNCKTRSAGAQDVGDFVCTAPVANAGGGLR